MTRRPASTKRARSQFLRSINNTPAFCEPLEQRRMLSTINWVNRGILSGPNSDNVNSVFGPVIAGQVRPLIDAVLQSWSRVVSNFNYPGGGNTYSITISFAATGTSLGANAGPTSFASDGKPTAGGMTIGRGNDTSTPPDGIGDGGGWFVDNTPFDNSEFRSSTTNGFAGYTTAGTSPALNMADMYQVVLHETGHALGLLPTAPIQARSTNTGVVDTINQPASNPPSTFWRFDGAHVKTLETSWDSGGQSGNQFNAGGSQHHANAAASVVANNITYLGSDDLMTASYSFSQRRLISDTDAWMLADSYGYSIQLPSVFGTYYDTLDADGTLRIKTPGNGNDIIALDISGSNVIVNLNMGTPVPGADITNSIASLFPSASVQRIVIDAGAGNDTIRLENIGGKPVTVSGGSGDDIINLDQTYRNLDLFGGGTVLVNGDAGNDSVFVYDNSNTRADTYSINSNGMTRNGWAGFTYGTAVEHASLVTGTAANPVNITSTNQNQDVTVNSAGGGDTVTVGGTGTAQSLFGNVQIQNSPSFSTLNIVDTNDFGNRDVVIDNNGSFGVMTGLTGPIGGAISWANNDVNNLSITTSQFGGGTFAVRALSVPMTLHCQGSGAYAVTMGGNSATGMQSITAAVTLIASYGQNQSLTLNDAANTAGRTISVTRSNVNGDYTVAGMTLSPIVWRDFGSMAIQEGSGNDSFSIDGGIMGDYLPLTVNGGAGNDAFNLTAFDNWRDGLGGTSTWPVTFNGDSGFNSLSIIDTARTTASYVLYPDRFFSREPSGFGQGSDFNYDNMNSMALSCSNSGNAVTVVGTSSDIDPGNQISIALNGGNDSVTVVPHDAQGNRTINGNIGIGGGTGTDTLLVSDTASALPITYTFANPFGAGTQNISGMGTAGFGIASDFEGITMNGSTGADVYNINSYKSGMGLAINGGNGNDTVNYGLSVVTSEVTLMSSFNFNGQNDFDTFNFNNPGTAGAATYTRSVGNLGVSPAAGGGYSLFESNNELMQIFAGSAIDTYRANSAATGTKTIFNGGGGTDAMFVGFSTANLDSIQGTLVCNGEAGGASLTVNDSLDATGDIAHLTASTVGAFAGDNLFGAGGALSFTGITGTMTLNLGSGADTAYAAPNLTAPITITGGNPTSGSGDSLNLALADAQNFVLNGTAASGNVTSDNLKTLSYSAFETGPDLDASAPAAGAIDFELGGLGRRGAAAQSIAVTFTEDVAGLISNGLLSLTNTTTGQIIPTDNIALAYDPGTFTATFTFLYPSGLLPDGAYQAQVAAGYTDLFGNEGAASDVYTFIWSGGTENADNFRVTKDGGTLDFLVYLNDDTTPAFVADQTASKIALAGGDGDDAFSVDTAGITPGGVILNGGAGANSFALTGTSGADTAVFSATDVTINGGLVGLANIDARSYDGAGEYDTLTLNAGSTTLVGSQRFANLVINDGATALMQAGTGSTLVTRQLTMGSAALLDMTDNDLLVDINSGAARGKGRGGDPLMQIQALINAARNGGAWDGFGITSSTARDASPRNTTLGAMRGSDFKSVYGPASMFNNEAITDGAALVKYTYAGDNDFNGVVNFDDYSRTDAGFNQGRSGWLNGDFDGNGVVNFDDYSLIDLAFNTQGAAL